MKVNGSQGPVPVNQPAQSNAIVYHNPTLSAPSIPMAHILAALLALIIVFVHKLPFATDGYRLAAVFVFYGIAALSFYDNLPIMLLFSILLLHAVFQYKLSEAKAKTQQIKETKN
jgi:hypothetical protein